MDKKLVPSAEAQAPVPETDAYSSLCNSLGRRFDSWRRLVEDLIAFFKQLEVIVKNSSRDYNKLSRTIVIPFRDANVFDEHGVQDVFTSLRDQTATIAADNDQLAVQIPGSITKVLELLRDDLKEHCKKITTDGGRGVKTVEKHRTETQRLLTQLDRTLLPWRGEQPPVVGRNNDPFIVDRLVCNSLHRQVAEENNHAHVLVGLQELSYRFEINMVNKIKECIVQFEQLMAAHLNKTILHIQDIRQISDALPSTMEWEQYMNNEPDFIKGDIVPRNADSIVYPGKNDQPTVPIIKGQLVRKTKILKKKQAGFYAFTHSGYLYEFKSADPLTDPEPEFALYIPDCLIGRPSDKKAKFKITGKDATKRLFSTRYEYTFSAANHADIMKWWEALNANNPDILQRLPPDVPSASDDDDDDDDAYSFSPTAATHSRQASVNRQASLNRQGTIPSAAAAPSAPPVPDRPMYSSEGNAWAS
ncbi:cytoskeletal signaling protein [Schizosaccharomyces japonicus yFS275]|uniref:Cytoskeletal signaling protein n=1 Tax=Schizosaccharomyces japonicus (strain yFS275 / FY16936) TaxID=402676 RepID=B6K310_SCHJY|nr:cytoskeletal signaling protein [Schizosaccharomyces japonicus yFS275]EEB07867.1 cytoskeletal signaling protein [Schizosaccharomyces japonicus yFS275]